MFGFLWRVAQLPSHAISSFITFNSLLLLTITLKLRSIIKYHINCGARLAVGFCLDLI